MSFMFEVYYKAPSDPEREAVFAERVSRFGGQCSFREGHENGSASICLTFEFDELAQAELAADDLRVQGVHVEGPSDYGP